MTDFGWSLENKDIVFTMTGGGCEEKEVGYSGLGRSSVKTDEITIALPFIHTTSPKLRTWQLQLSTFKIFELNHLFFEKSVYNFQQLL